MLSIKMCKVHHLRQGVLILVTFVLFAWECCQPRQGALIESRKQTNCIDKQEYRQLYGPISTQYPLTQISQRYQLIKNNAHNKLSDIDPLFKKILFWNEAYGSKNYGVGHGHDALRKYGCPVWQCETTDNRSSAHEYDAVVFHLRSWTQQDLPERRLPQQRYVFWSMESPDWDKWLSVDTGRLANFFNWTMTYRWDSDMVSPYGYTAPIGNVPLHPSDDQMKRMKQSLLGRDATVNYAHGKTKMAVLFVSNCRSFSKRMELVKELKKYVDVDVYGSCGTKVCSQKNEEDCRKMAAKNYKFYLSRENSLCLGYVTEKYFTQSVEKYI